MDRQAVQLAVRNALEKPSATLILISVDPSSSRLGVESLRAAVNRALLGQNTVEG